MEEWHDQEAPVAAPVVAPQGVEVPRGEVEQIVRLVWAAAAALPGQAQGLSFQNLSLKPRLQPLLFCESRGLV